MKIYVITIAGKLIPIKIEQTDTIEDLKNKIQEKEGMTTERQKLIFSAQVLEDDKTLKYYSIKEETKTALHFNRFDLEVRVNLPKAEEITIELEPLDTIQKVKEKLFEKKSFPIEQQRLFYRYNQLKDENTLVDYSFKNTSKIFLLLFSKSGIVVFVNSTPYLVNLTDTVESLKKQISERNLIPIEDQILI